MNKYILLSLSIFLACQQPSKVDSTMNTREYYQLKIYSFDSENQQLTTDQYLSDVFIPLSKKLGFGPIGVFKNRLTAEDSARRTYVLVPLKSPADVEVLEDLATDSLSNDYLNASYDGAPYNRMESIILKAFEDWPALRTPALSGPRVDRVYELRSYESPTEAYYRNKVDMFNAGGEVLLFERLDFNAVFYGEVLSGSKMPNLMYMTTFENFDQREAHWKAFVESPEWKALITNPRYDHNVSHADIWLLYPTDYSDY